MGHIHTRAVFGLYLSSVITKYQPYCLNRHTDSSLAALLHVHVME